ncbi:uncharacterized protein LOC126838130 [Adelges cooleyi]|uniref:uncharacterized protein LOC126838130 n=1 Tax=Adelges cooleyi TaxID=133065 RepID=UPI00217FAC57|nr:uncharacterized protein LOC126838130 [Adelges cooleyi]
MIWEITFLLACFNVLITSQSGGPVFPGESSRSGEIPKEYLEPLYHKDVVGPLSEIPTLDMSEVAFNDKDYHFLTTECKVDEDCLNNKKASVEKYHQRMQAIQCVNGLYVLNVLDELKSIMVGLKNNSTSISSLQETVEEYKFYMSSILTLLHIAKSDPYAWQIEMFTFLSGLADSDVNIKSYVDHFESLSVSMRNTILVFVNRCVQHSYLMSLDNRTAEKPVFRFIESVYKDFEVIAIPRLLYTVPNLMLQYLYPEDDFIFDWSEFEIKLDTSNVNREMRTQLGFYCPQNLVHEWQLDPIGGNKYNVLIAKYIHLRLEYVAWFHLYLYRTLLDRELDGPLQNPFLKKTLIKLWITLAPYLKCVLRYVGFNENIYWSAMNIMMVDFKKISKEELAAREKYTRNYFCQSVEDLGLASASDINQQLKKVSIPKDYRLMYIRIVTNVSRTDQYCSDIITASQPSRGEYRPLKFNTLYFKERYIRILLNAEGNENFVMREKI